MKIWIHRSNTQLKNYERPIIEVNKYNVTCIPIARQRLGKHIPAEAIERNNRTSIAKQRISKHASLTIEAAFSSWSVQSGYKEVFSNIE
jgi:hypothetical protein